LSVFAVLVGCVAGLGAVFFRALIGLIHNMAILAGNLVLPGLLALLFSAKLFATTVSLGSGASGGIFSPSLFMGAMIGGAFGAAITAIHPVAGISPMTCAIVGMAAMVGGSTGAAMAAVTMIFEMTRDYDLVMPAIRRTCGCSRTG
jgi:chloride channel protein, CIC family